MSTPQEFVFDTNAPMEMNARWLGDDRLYVQFYLRPVMNNFKSAEAGRPIFDEKDFVRIIAAGDKNSVVDTFAKESYQRRFATRYAAYKANQEQVAVSGTPVSAVPWIGMGLAAELKAMNVHTVEQLANMADTHAQKIMGYSKLKDKAEAFLLAAAGEAGATKMAFELEQRDGEIAALKGQMAELMKSMEVMQLQSKTNVAAQAKALVT